MSAEDLLKIDKNEDVIAPVSPDGQGNANPIVPTLTELDSIPFPKLSDADSVGRRITLRDLPVIPFPDPAGGDSGQAAGAPVQPPYSPQLGLGTGFAIGLVAAGIGLGLGVNLNGNDDNAKVVYSTLDSARVDQALLNAQAVVGPKFDKGLDVEAKRRYIKKAAKAVCDIEVPIDASSSVEAQIEKFEVDCRRQVRTVLETKYDLLKKGKGRKKSSAQGKSHSEADRSKSSKRKSK